VSFKNASRRETLFGGVNRFCGNGYKSNNVLTKIGSHLRIFAQCGKAARRGHDAPLLRQSFGVSRDSLAGISQCLVYIIACRKAAGEIGKPNTGCSARSCVL
jgi:hypothetical protein